MLLKSLSLFTILWIFTGLKGTCQSLLNEDSIEIRKDVSLERGVLKNLKAYNGYKIYFFRYPSAPEGNDCLIKTAFYFKGNKCFKYYETYWGDKLAYKRIDELKQYYPRLQRIKSELKWIDADKKFEVHLIPEKEGKNVFASVYILEIKKT